MQGVCKDCGNGTLNNEVNPAFDTYEEEEGTSFVYCLECGSFHVEVL